MSKENIWSNIDFNSNNKKVLDYLKEQSKFLNEITQGVLQMQIENITAYDDYDNFNILQLYKLYVVSENLGNFRIKLLTIIQNNEGPEFPVKIYSDIERKEYPNIEEESFITTLNDILSKRSVQNVIVNLYKQSEEEIKQIKR